MLFRTFFLGAIVVLAVALAWQEHDPSSLRSVLASAGVSMPATLDRSVSGRAERAATGLRKCRDGAGQLTYTNGACAAGSRQEAIGAGSVTVVQGGLPSPSASAPNLMNALSGPGLGDLQRKRIDRAVGE